MTADPIEKHVCTCGSDMEVSGTRGYHLCNNCDRPQEKEYLAERFTADQSGNLTVPIYFKRVETPEDRRYALKWKELMGEIYGEGGSGL